MSRRAFDFYETPPWQTRALLRRLPDLRGLTFLEPCSGDGSLVREIAHLGSVVTNDIDPARAADLHGDATDPEWWASLGSVRADVVITNPPFSTAHLILPHAIRHARRLVIMLGRMSWLEPTEERDPLWQVMPPDGLIILPRWSYKANGATDSVTTGWHLWGACLRGRQPIYVVSREEKAA